MNHCSLRISTKAKIVKRPTSVTGKEVWPSEKKNHGGRRGGEKREAETMKEG